MQSHVSEDVLDARKKFNDYAEGMLKSMDEKFVAMTEEEALEEDRAMERNFRKEIQLASAETISQDNIKVL